MVVGTGPETEVSLTGDPTTVPFRKRRPRRVGVEPDEDGEEEGPSAEDDEFVEEDDDVVEEDEDEEEVAGMGSSAPHVRDLRSAGFIVVLRWLRPRDRKMDEPPLEDEVLVEEVVDDEDGEDGEVEPSSPRDVGTTTRSRPWPIPTVCWCETSTMETAGCCWAAAVRLTELPLFPLMMKLMILFNNDTRV